MLQTKQSKFKPRKQKTSTYFNRVKEFIFYFVVSPVRMLFVLILKRQNIAIIYRTAGGHGDSIVMTATIEFASSKYGLKFIVFSKYPEFFLNNPHIIKHLNYNTMNKTLRGFLKSFFKYMRSSNVICIGGEAWSVGTWPFEYQHADYLDSIWSEGLYHDNAIYLEHIPKVNPKIYFTEQEISDFKSKFNLPENFCIIKASVGITKDNALLEDRHSSAMRKEFGIGNMQYIVDNTQNANWIQIGQSNEIELQNCKSFVGKTTLRETLVLLSMAKLVLTVEGFIYHACAAVDVKTYVVMFGNNHDYVTLLYNNATPIIAEQMPDCAPCWSEECLLPQKLCLLNINKDAVIKNINKMLVD